MRPSKSCDGTMPESMIATPMPLPVGLAAVRPSVSRSTFVPEAPPEGGPPNAETAELIEDVLDPLVGRHRVELGRQTGAS